MLLCPICIARLSVQALNLDSILKTKTRKSWLVREKFKNFKGLVKTFSKSTFWAVSGCNDYTLFARGELDSIDVLPSLKTFTSPSECHLCLGILDINKFDSYRQKFRESVENWPLTKENSAKEVQLLISIPASILLLEKIIFFKLRKEFPDANVKELSPVSLKEIIKTVCYYKTFDKSKVFISSERFVQHWIRFENPS